MNGRAQTVLTWSGAISLIGVLVTAIVAAARGGVEIENVRQGVNGKVDKAAYQQDQTALERRLGDIQGDIRVIRAAVCGQRPGACQ